MFSMNHRWLRVPKILTIFLVACCSAAFASGPYVIGSSNTVTADPLIPRPSTTPCVVQLLNNAEFDNFDPVPFTYTPPAGCPGPVGESGFHRRRQRHCRRSVRPHRQLLARPHKHLFRDDGRARFDSRSVVARGKRPNRLLADIHDRTTRHSRYRQPRKQPYTGIIFASSTLEFYPVPQGQTAPVTANQVYALSAGPSGGTVTLASTTDTLSGTFSLPINIQNAYLDVYAQSQNQDEFWYTCVPNDVSGELFSCGNTGFRETEITIDGNPAGVAPIFPGSSPEASIPTSGSHFPASRRSTSLRTVSTSRRLPQS